MFPQWRKMWRRAALSWRRRFAARERLRVEINWFVRRSQLPRTLPKRVVGGLYLTSADSSCMLEGPHRKFFSSSAS